MRSPIPLLRLCVSAANVKLTTCCNLPLLYHSKFTVTFFPSFSPSSWLIIIWPPCEWKPWFPQGAFVIIASLMSRNGWIFVSSAGHFLISATALLMSKRSWTFMWLILEENRLAAADASGLPSLESQLSAPQIVRAVDLFSSVTGSSFWFFLCDSTSISCNFSSTNFRMSRQKPQFFVWFFCPWSWLHALSLAGLPTCQTDICSSISAFAYGVCLWGIAKSDSL